VHILCATHTLVLNVFFETNSQQSLTHKNRKTQCKQNQWAVQLYLACSKAYGEYLGFGCGGAPVSRLFHLFWTVLAMLMLMQVLGFGFRLKGLGRLLDPVDIST
jgi:hypothetical protein